MSATTHVPLLQPIALRKPCEPQPEGHTTNHPFQALRLRALDYEVAATQRAELLSRAFTAIRATIEEAMSLVADSVQKRPTSATDNLHSTSPYEVSASKQPNELDEIFDSVRAAFAKITILAPLLNYNPADNYSFTTRTKIIEAVLVTLPQQYRELGQLLADCKGIEKVPPLASIREALFDYYGAELTFPRLGSVQSFKALEPAEKLVARATTLEASLRALEAPSSRVQDKQAKVILAKLLDAFAEDIDNALVRPSWLLHGSKLGTTIDRLKQYAADPSMLNLHRSIFQALHDIARLISAAAKESSYRLQFFGGALDDTKLSAFLETVLSPENSMLLYNFDEAIKPRLIKAAVTAEITRHLDPLTPGALAIAPDRWLPPRLMAACSGLGISSSGELVVITKGGDPQALITAVATLLDAKDPSLFREGHINNRLVPVIRAALPGAYELVASWRAARDIEEARRTRQETAQAEAAKEALEFVEFFFDDALAKSLPVDGPKRDTIRRSFVTRYTDPELIDTRQSVLNNLAAFLSIPSQYLTNHYEYYLLTNRELDRWSKQVQRLKAQMLKSADPADHLAVHDPSNFLPSALPELLGRHVLNHSDID